MVGRWPCGIPLAVAPTWQEYQSLKAKWAGIPTIQLMKSAQRTPAQKEQLAQYDRLLVDFRYGDDIAGAKCPMSAHIRRSNPRDALDPMLASSPPGPAPTT